MSERQLVSIGEATKHLRIEPGDDDESVLNKVQQATDIVLDFVTDAAASTWDEEAAPGEVKAATLLILTELYDNRAAASDPLSEPVRRLLWRHRDPSLA